MPYCHVNTITPIFSKILLDLVNVDCESEAEDDMLPISRKGEVWRTKLELITQKTLPVHFFVYPVGKEVMWR
ncbi:hypothetical protein Peur_011822 [Populus x canadensis]